MRFVALIKFLTCVEMGVSALLKNDCTKSAEMSDYYEDFALWNKERTSRQLKHIYPSSFANGFMIYPQLRPEGFNNQMISFYFYIRACILSGAMLVLPLMIESNQWSKFSTMGPRGPFPLSDYFDTEELLKIVPIVDNKDFWVQCSNQTVFLLDSFKSTSEAAERELIEAFKNHQQERFTRITNVKYELINLKENEKVFLCQLPECSNDETRQHLVKVQILRAINRNIRNRNSSEKELSVLPTCIAVHRYLISNLGLGKKEFFNYQKGYQGHSINNLNFRRIFASLKPSKPLLCVTKMISERILMETESFAFNGMHVRRGDFRAFLESFEFRQKYDKIINKRKSRRDGKVSDGSTDYSRDSVNLIDLYQDRQSILQNDSVIIQTVLKQLHMPLLHIFVASDEPFQIKSMLMNAGVAGLKVYILQDFLHLFPLWMRERNDLHLVVEQSLLVDSNLFIGNRFSSVSAHVFRHRLLQNKTSSTF